MVRFRRAVARLLGLSLSTVLISSLLVNWGGSLSEAAYAAGVLPSDAHSTSVSVDGVSGDIEVTEWLAGASGTHSGADFHSASDATYTLAVPSSVTSMDVLAFGGGGGGGGGTLQTGQATFGGGGGGGGGEVRRYDNLAVTPGESLSLQVGRAGAKGTPNTSGGNGGNTFLKRGTTTLLEAIGGSGGQAGQYGRAGGAGGSGGSGGTLVANGISGTNGSGIGTSPSDTAALDNSGASWVFAGTRYAAGGGGGGGRQVFSGSGTAYSKASTASTTASGFTATGDRLGGDGEGGDDAYATTSAGRINAFEYSGSGGGGGGAVFSNSGAGGGYGGAGGLIVAYALADLDTSDLSVASSVLRANSSTQVTLQLRKDSVIADKSAGPTSFSVSGLSGATLSSVTDNNDGTYTATLTSGEIEGTATISATIRGESFSDSVNVTVSRLSQNVTWNQPTSLVLANSGDAATAATTSGDGQISYSVVSAGTTDCAIDSSTGVLTFDGIGTCSVKAKAEETNTYNEASTTVSVTISQGTFAVSGPSSKVGTSSSAFTNVCVSSCDVTGFDADDDILVVVSKSDGTALSGRVRLDSSSFAGGLTLGDLGNVTGYNGDSSSNLNNASGYGEIAFEGTQAEVNAALETLQYKSPAGGGDETIGISASLAGAAYYSGNGHYYKFVSASVNWTVAKAAAAASTFNGLTGYLATITSAGENTFIVEKTGGAQAWVGGSDEYSQINIATGASTFANQTEAEGHWYWVTGPEAGTEFWDEHGNPSADGRISGQFQYWNNAVNSPLTGAEPNNAGSPGSEHYLQLRVGGTGDWNDLPNTSTLAYVIEYGGNGETVLKQASTTFDVGAPTAPLQVTGLSLTTGDSKLTLSWTAPGSGGSAITDYVIEQSTDGGSTWSTMSDGTSTATSYVVTGLTNGSSYSFRVSAKNVIGTGTASSSASGTPAVVVTSSSGGSSSATQTPASPVVVTPLRAPRVLPPITPAVIPRALQAPVESPGRGFDASVGTRATVGGAPATALKRAIPGGVSVQAGAFQFGVTLADPSAGAEASGSSDLSVKSGSVAKVNGSGMLPGSPVQVWLPGRSGSDSRELSRAVVGTDGQVETELTFVAKPSEAPIPIGSQVLQITGYDDEGNLTVVDMPVNIAQGPIVPEPNRDAGALPDLVPGRSLATSAGSPVEVAVVALPAERSVVVGDGSWEMTVEVDNERGTIEGESESPIVRMEQFSVASASGEGFQPGTTASVWMFSDPTLMATVLVSEDGSFTTDFLVDPQFLPAGEHTLQIQGVGEDGFIKAANLGVLVEEPVVLTSDSASGLLWWVVGAFMVALLLLVIVVVARRKRSS